ncbi:uncharacterized protein METZ01_LOCUS144158 [marine metagenome]|uniref:Uncharacterized protein n=1 Tax=marine metagenome TaxID=408172 RepID=A0A381ZQA4_9ZZZZ
MSLRTQHSAEFLNGSHSYPQLHAAERIKYGRLGHKQRILSES